MTTLSESGLTFSSDSVSLHPPPFSPSPSLFFPLFRTETSQFFNFLSFFFLAPLPTFCYSAFSPPLWAYHGCCYTSSQCIYTGWCHTEGDGLFAVIYPVTMLPSLTQLFKLTSMWLLVAELQVQTNLSSPPNKETIVFSQLGTQTTFKWTGKYWYNNYKSLMFIYCCACVVVVIVLYTSMCERVHVSLRVSLPRRRSTCHVTFIWYAYILVRLAVPTASFTCSVTSAKYFLYKTITLQVFLIMPLLILEPSDVNRPRRFASNFQLLLCCVMWYWSCHGNHLHLQSVIYLFIYLFTSFFGLMKLQMIR